ncbi:SGNH/GDSL hydrolase family protein [Tichowtungia aerotolerans]|uniref:SGNH hydrolase-type esterase domain-containing protein n=1 Tax=Tichowtungia aerotolerans TaxID=2697043 RepID=A0A6P1M2M8_9BACT|nr:SGNH/GDSL hydrolase family protein [Tichowtungia aerotolerans]QHI69089.1 hypothetical protein GT409_06390 [Tichowtungia aerotolerans]
MKKPILFAILLSSISSAVEIHGLRYVTETEEGIRFARFREDILAMPTHQLGLNPAKAQNTSGGIVAFKTDAAQITAHFKILSANYMGAGFGVFENSKLIEEFKFSPQATDAVLKFQSTQPGESLFEIVLPSFANVEFQGLESDGGKVPTIGNQKGADSACYVALGDSISHGVGQDGYGHKTWPFLLSRKLNMELFNLAVGGGKIAVPVAEMLEDWKWIDLITILVGYNGLHFNDKSPETYKADYARLLDAIRKNHPETKIVCISLLTTKKPVSEKTGHTVDEFRAVLEKLVAEHNDPNLILIKGEEVSSEKNLQADKPQDPVHLSIEGAALLADSLFEKLTSSALFHRKSTNHQ